MKDILTTDDILKAKTEEQEHLWVKISVTVLRVWADHESIAVAIDAEAQKQADEDAVLGCYFCDEMLTYETLGTKCPGPDKKMQQIMPSDDT